MRALSVVLMISLTCSKKPEATSEQASTKASPEALREGHLELIPFPGGDIAGYLRQEVRRAQAEGKDIVVYVGAPWCEPCTRFHKAAKAGELDAAFPSLRMIEFDHDSVLDQLRANGYVSRLIPLFAIPRDDGRASGIQMEGSIKGEGAVSEIAPRLRALLERAKAK